MQGYIKLYRSLFDNPLFQSEPFTKGQAWITILLLTNHKDSFIRIKNGEIIKIERGECGYSELALAKIFQWSRGKVKRFLNLLESEKMIHQKNRANRTIIEVLNYENYQSDTVNNTVNGHLTGQQTDINNNDNNDNNDKNIDARPKKIDPYASSEIQTTVRIYSEFCTDLIPISNYSLDRPLRTLIAEYLEDTHCDFEYFKDVCIKANKLKQIGDFKIDLKSLIKNHSGIYGGKYKPKEEVNDVYNPCL